MRRWIRQRLWMWMGLVAAIALPLGVYRVAADRRAAAEALDQLLIKKWERHPPERGSRPPAPPATRPAPVFSGTHTAGPIVEGGGHVPK